MARAYNQAQKFGAEMAIPDEVTALASGEAMTAAASCCTWPTASACARAVVIASGARYRRLDGREPRGVRGLERALLGLAAGGAKLCAGQEVALVGAGNSAGQAAVYLASQVAKVWLLVRGRDLEASMSRYLVDRIAGLPNVEVVTQPRSAAWRAATACWRRSAGAKAASGRRRAADPPPVPVHRRRSEHRLAGRLRRGARRQGLRAHRHRRARAAGDQPARRLRHRRRALGSVKRVAAAVGEGAQVVAALHGFLASTHHDLGHRGAQPFGASSKPLNSNPGATVQPTSVQSPRLSAACQA